MEQYGREPGIGRVADGDVLGSHRDSSAVITAVRADVGYSANSQR